MKKEWMGVTEYRDKHKKDCTVTYIQRAARNGKLHTLPNVISVKKSGKSWLLEVLTN